MSLEPMAAIYARLNDVSITSLVDLYKGDPAIFSGDLPEDAPDKYVFIPEVTQSSDESDKNTNTNSRDESFDITCVVRKKKPSNFETANALADAVTRRLNRATLPSVSGVSFDTTTCSFSNSLNNQDDYIRLCRFNVICRES